LGVKGNYGGDIFIHGATMTVGCIPLTDDKIKEVYLYAVEARNAGQTQIPVHIFPSKLDDVHFEELKTIARSNEFLEYWTIWSGGKPADANKFIRFWESLKRGYDYFDKTNTLPHVSVKSNGEYQVN
jgi:murein L,D-transpeptidase YafK